MGRIYLDHNATTPVDPRVRDAIMEALETEWGNPSSLHDRGRGAADLLEKARESVAALINAAPSELVFTSGGTEAGNLAALGAARQAVRRGKLKRVVTSRIEHPCIKAACQKLESEGFEVVGLPADESGKVSAEEAERAITEKTALVTVMAANNETGVIQPIKEIGELARNKGVLFHTDAVQYAGKLPVDVRAWPVDLLSLSAHKFYGPKGAGALWIRRGVEIAPRQQGGSQEMGVRVGTENLPGIAGLGAAAAIAREELDIWIAHIERLRDAFERMVLERIGEVAVNGDREGRISNTSNLSFYRAEGEAVLISLDLAGVEVSAGSACSSGKSGGSPVLSAMGFAAERINSAIRFSLGKDNTEEEMEKAAAALEESVRRIRSISAKA